MVKIICDKCGCEILPPKKPRKVKSTLYYMHFDIFGESVDEPTVKYDLCPECADVLLSWLGTKGEERP